jgi:hypothetical protein
MNEKALIEQINNHLPSDKVQIDINEILTDLFKLLSQVLYDANTPLRKYVEFVSNDKLHTNDKYWLLLKGGKFEYTTIDASDFNVVFRGSINQQCSKEELVKYVKDVVYGYIQNEARLISMLTYYEPQINSFFKSTPYLQSKKDPKFTGIYFGHRFNISFGKVSCNSKIAFLVL